MRFACAAAMVLLAACSEEVPDPANKVGAAPSAPVSTAEPFDKEVNSRFSSRYTALDIDHCDETDRSEEGASATWACEGFNGTPYWIHLGDGRFDIDAGERADDRFATIGAFNELGETLEWRLEDGKPFAVIFRYRDVTPEAKGRTVLAVEKIAQGSVPGCRVAQIAGDEADPNLEARHIADMRSATFDCTKDRPTYIGDAR